MEGRPKSGRRQDPGPNGAASGNWRLLPRALVLEGMVWRCGDKEMMQGCDRALQFALSRLILKAA